jgi:lipopolysaccharide cholinephosphotransferase
MENMEEIYQNEMLRIVSYIDKVLTENNIWYSVAYGTILGAIRENGFIPWDRDADVFIKLPDRERARKVLKENLPADLVYNDSSRNTVGCMDGIISKQYGDFTTVDIYTLIGAPDTDHMEASKVKAILRRNKFCTKFFGAKYGDWHKLRKAYKIAPYLFVKFFLCLIPNSVIRRILRHYEYKYDFETSPFIMTMVSYRRPGDIMPREIFDEVVRHNFENIEVNVPRLAHNYCSRSYGEDYMTPKQTGWK